MKEKTISTIIPAEKQIKAHIFQGKEKNKQFLLTAGIHGDEATSIVVLRDTLSYLERIEEDLLGTVIVIPLCNPEAFRYKERTSPADSQDLNRAFPGNKEGGITERVAASIWSIAKNSDYILDLHGCGMNCYPYILTLHEKHLAKSFVRNIPWEFVVHSHGTDGQLFVEALREDIPAAIIEMRGGDAYLDLEDRTTFREVIQKTIHNLGFLQTGGEKVVHTFLGEIEQIISQGQGVFIPKVKPGDTVEENEKIGELTDTPLLSPVAGRVVKLSRPAIVFPGDLVAGVASKAREEE